jgi:hypothetical protein
MIKAKEIITEAKKQIEGLNSRGQCEKLVLAQIGSMGFKFSGGGMSLGDGAFDIEFHNRETKEVIWMDDLGDGQLSVKYWVDTDDYMRKEKENETTLSMKSMSKLPSLIKKWRKSKK